MREISDSSFYLFFKRAKQKISDEKAVKRAEQELVKVDEQIKVWTTLWENV